MKKVKVLDGEMCSADNETGMDWWCAGAAFEIALRPERS